MNKTVVFGIDGGDWDIIKPWLEAGELPNFERIIKKGGSGILITTLPSNSASCWTSFATGCNPGKHGVYGFLKYKDNFKERVPLDSRDIQVKTFYEALEEEGFRPFMINLPLSTPPRVDTPLIGSFASKYPEPIFPEELKNEIDFEGFKFALDSYERARNVYKHSLDYLKSRKEALDNLWEKDWDLWFELYSLTDWVQHNYLGKLEKDKTEQKLLDIYKKADRRIGKFLEKDVNVFILSDHGFKVYNTILYVNEWLRRQGLLKLDRDKPPKGFWSNDDLPHRLLSMIGKSKILRKIFYFFLSNFWGAIPLPDLAKIRLETFLTSQIDFENSQAFFPHTSLRSIYARENSDFIDGLIEDLERISDAKIYRKEELYEGKAVSAAPDIIFERTEEHISKNITGKIKRKAKVPEHDRTGIFAAAGPDIKEGFEKDISIMDLAPTILELYGVDQSHTDGEVLKEVIK